MPRPARKTDADRVEDWVQGGRGGGLRATRYGTDGKARVGVARTEESKARGAVEMTATQLRASAAMLVRMAERIEADQERYR
jgi:hypothetical protein